MKEIFKNIARHPSTLPIILGVVITSLMLTSLSHILGNVGSRYLFLKDPLWIAQVMGTIGGATTLITSWVAQWAQHPIVGAMMVGAVFAGAYCLLRTSRDRFGLAIIAVLYLFSGYMTAQFLLTAVAALLNFAIFRAWRSLGTSNVALWLIPIALLLAYAASSTAFMLVAILISCDILFSARSILVKIIAIVAVALLAWITPWIGGWIYGVSSSAAYGMVWIEGCKIDTTLFLIVGAIAIISKIKTPEWIDSRRWIALVLWGAIVGVSIAIFITTFKSNIRQVMLIEQAADREDWQSVIERASKYTGENHTTTYLLNVALFRQGEFVDRIFDYPQPFGPLGLFIEWSENNNELQMKLADLVYANLGLINEAHRLTFESMNNSGQNTLALSRLAHYNRLLGRDKIARKFEQRLSQTMFYKPSQSRHATVTSPINSWSDSLYTATDNLAQNISAILAHDPTNKVAADYLAIYHLLSIDVNGFVALMPTLQSIYGDHLPRIYNEALLVAKVFNPEGMATFTPNAAEATRFAQFNRTLQSGGLQSAYNDYHSTYWYYVAWVMSQRSQR